MLFAHGSERAGPATSADLGPGPQTQFVEPVAPPNQWQFSFTPYGWATSINGSATARGHTVDIDESFIEIVEKSDSLMALMGYFEARKGPFALFTDVVWADLTFDGQRRFDINRTVSGNPFARLPDFNVTIKGNLDIKANAQVDYRSTIVQSGAAYEVAKWGSQSHIVHRLGRSGWCTLLEPGTRYLAEGCRHADCGCSSRF